MPLITEDVRPKNAGDFATHDDQYALGGFRPVADNTERDAISLGRRKEGMRVYVISTDTIYRKALPLADNGASWVVASSGTPVDPDARPYTVPAGALSTIYVDAAGDDNAAGTIGAPLATVGEAIRRVAIANGFSDAVTIEVGAGVFVLPETIALGNWITIQGTESAGTALAVSSVVNAVDNGGIVVDVTGIAGSAADDHRGELLEFTSGAADTTRGWVYRSDASVGANTRLYITQDDPDTLIAPAALDTLQFLDLDTELQHTGIPVVSSSVQFNIRSALITGSQPVFYNITDKVEYRFCRIEVTQPVVGRFGSAFFWCCYIASLGNTNNGMFGVVNTGNAQVERGTVIDAGLQGSAANTRFVKVFTGARLVIKGQLAVRDLDGGILVTNSDFVADNPTAVHHGVLFESQLGAAIDNLNGVIYDGAISQGLLPHLYGNVASDYAIVTDPNACACIRLPPGSALATNTALNAVSADGGVSAVSENLQSVIYGGVPNVRRITPQIDNQGTVGEAGLRWGAIYTNDLITGDLVLEAPDGSARYRFVEAAGGVINVTDEVSGKKYLLPLIEVQEDAP